MIVEVGFEKKIRTKAEQAGDDTDFTTPPELNVTQI